jgi:hypothetical protein
VKTAEFDARPAGTAEDSAATLMALLNGMWRRRGVLPCSDDVL